MGEAAEAWDLVRGGGKQGLQGRKREGARGGVRGGMRGNCT